MLKMLLPALLLLLPISTSHASKNAVAVFAGGCFWCMQSELDKVPGIKKTVVGYTGGHTKNPSYHQVGTGTTGHIEAIKVLFDPAIISYKKLLEHFWKNVDPTDAGGQFCDRGNTYISRIFYLNNEQKKLATASKAELAKKMGSKKIATDIVSASRFYPAESYHQEYYKKNPVRYKFYRYRCGRDARLRQLWK